MRIGIKGNRKDHTQGQPRNQEEHERRSKLRVSSENNSTRLPPEGWGQGPSNAMVTIGSFRPPREKRQRHTFCARNMQLQRAQKAMARSFILKTHEASAQLLRDGCADPVDPCCSVLYNLHITNHHSMRNRK